MKQHKRPILYYLGNILILSSVILSLFIYYPLLALYIYPPDIQLVSSLRGDFITIPKIQAQAPLILNVDPWNKSDYMPKLQKGVAHAKGTALPGMHGTTFLFAHSSDLPWNITRYNTAFFRLSELSQGDSIILTIKDKPLRYEVVDRKEVEPQAVNYLQKNSTDQLILQTCVPIGTSLRRLLIFAKPA